MRCWLSNPSNLGSKPNMIIYFLIENKWNSFRRKSVVPSDIFHQSPPNYVFDSFSFHNLSKQFIIIESTFVRFLYEALMYMKRSCSFWNFCKHLKLKINNKIYVINIFFHAIQEQAQKLYLLYI